MFTAYSFSQEYRNSGFSKPMNLPFNLAGSFGEPRPDHFHSGIDIKTNGVEGQPVFAVYDGYISRIRVSPYGYGRAIYITHPNGFTTVYGHLSRFYGAIEKYIDAQHYALKKSELDLTPDASVFPLKQNDTIAFSGNTGGSDAPHLHFEVRNTQTEHALNPLDFYPRSFYVDTIPPQINKVKVYELNSNFYPVSTHEYQLKRTPNYLTTDSIIQIISKNFYFSLEGFDKQDYSENKNGINTIEVYQNGEFKFRYDLTEIDFDKTRMCNAFVDYNEMKNGNGYYYNCYKLQNNNLPFYIAINNGIINCNTNDSIEIDVFCLDYNNNKVKLKIRLVTGLIFPSGRYYDFQPEAPHTFHGLTQVKFIKSTQSDSIISNNFKIKFTSKSFYNDEFIEYTRLIRNDTTKSELSNYFEVFVFDKETPLHKPAKIEFKSAIKKNRNKIVIVRQNHKGKETALKTTFDKTKFYANTKELGTFYLKYDTSKPLIEISNFFRSFGTQISNLIIQAKIKDNLSGINTYNGYIDDQWVNFYYDAKNDVIQYNIDEHCSKGEHLLKIIVTDNVGNKNIVQQKFNY